MLVLVRALVSTVAVLVGCFFSSLVFVLAGVGLWFICGVVSGVCLCPIVLVIPTALSPCGLQISP